MRGDPFWGFDSVRAAMARGGRGPTWGLIVLGLVLIAVGLAFDGVLLAVMGALVVLAGVWPLVTARGSRRRAEQLAEHARREDEMVAAARRIANAPDDANDGRRDLAALVAADPDAAEVARRDCLRRAAAVQGSERDAWLDAANEIGHLRAPEEASR